MAKINFKARKQARKVAVQAIYQWQLAANDLSELLTQFLSHDENQELDREYFQQVVTGVLNQSTSLDEILQEHLDRPVQEVSPIELAILRIGVYELQNFLEIPYKVILNEAIELNKIYGASEGYRYVNGILDKVSRTLRKIEYEQGEAAQ